MNTKVLSIGACFLFFFTAKAQSDSLLLNLDFRTRAEMDNGQKTLIPKGKQAETSVYSRARLGIDYHREHLELYAALQDARVWGETGSTNQRSGSFNVYEAWAQYQFNEKVGVKIGRQILSYDDERLFGALDWQMQGRSFDAAKGIFILNPYSKLETVITYNNDDNDGDDLAENEFYNVLESGERTKSLQLIHYQYKKDKTTFSTIGLNSITQHLNGNHYDMVTLGANAKHYWEHFGVFGSVYYQVGKNSLAQSKSAYQFSLNADVLLGQHNIVLGTEWLSGTDFDEDTSKNHSFSPFYGTNHKFNGFMNYFFVGNHFNSVGLKDFYIKSNFKFNPKATLSANLHAFSSNAAIGYNANNDKLSQYLGTELDLVFQYKVASYFTLQVGHSHLFDAEGMQYLKNIHQPKDLQTWSWIGLNFNTLTRLK